MPADLQRAKPLRDRRAEYSERPCSPDHHGAAQGVHFGLDGAPERTISDPYIKKASQFAKETLLGQSFLGARLLR